MHRLPWLAVGVGIGSIGLHAMLARNLCPEEARMKRVVTAGDLVDQACEGVPSLVAPGQALAIEHTAHPVNSRLSIAKALRSMFNVFSLRWNDSSGTRNGHFAPFAWAG